jgi:hypothetical protein
MSAPANAERAASADAALKAYISRARHVTARNVWRICWPTSWSGPTSVASASRASCTALAAATSRIRSREVLRDRPDSRQHRGAPLCGAR